MKWDLSTLEKIGIIASVIFSILSLGIALFSLNESGEANDLSRLSNQISKNANNLSQKALEIQTINSNPPYPAVRAFIRDNKRIVSVNDMETQLNRDNWASYNALDEKYHSGLFSILLSNYGRVETEGIELNAKSNWTASYNLGNVLAHPIPPIDSTWVSMGIFVECFPGNQCREVPTGPQNVTIAIECRNCLENYIEETVELCIYESTKQFYDCKNKGFSTTYPYWLEKIMRDHKDN